MATPVLGTDSPTYPCPPPRVYEVGEEYPGGATRAVLPARPVSPVVLSPRWRQFFKKLCSVRKARRANAHRTGSV